MDPFALKFYSQIQDNIEPNFGDDLNFATYEHGFNLEIALKISKV